MNDRAGVRVAKRLAYAGMILFLYNAMAFIVSFFLVRHPDPLTYGFSIGLSTLWIVLLALAIKNNMQDTRWRIFVYIIVVWGVISFFRTTEFLLALPDKL